MENFIIEEGVLTELESGMQLQLIDEDKLPSDSTWISGWFNCPDGKFVVQHFVVLPTGKPSYKLANQAVNFYGEQILRRAILSAIQMSPRFGSNLLIPAVEQLYYI